MKGSKASLSTTYAAIFFHETQKRWPALLLLLISISNPLQNVEIAGTYHKLNIKAHHTFLTIILITFNNNHNNNKNTFIDVLVITLTITLKITKGITF